MARGGPRPNSGGKRPGAGRKKGAATKKTRKVANKIAADGEITPLQVMVEAMRYHYAAGNLDRAAELAKDAAPYLHPRLSSVQRQGTSEDHRLEIVVEVVSNGSASGAAAPGTTPLLE